MVATGLKQHECIRLLMREGGADTSIATQHPNHVGQTPAEVAAALGHDAKTLHELRRVCATCGKAARKLEGKTLLKCAVCGGAYYCSSVCQHVDWPKHALECQQMKVDAAAAKAAAAAAAEATAKAKAMPHCLGCSKTTGAGGGELSTCSRCNTARYCSRECQVKDFPRHKQADGCKK
jgi:hypothetical protein